MANEFVARRGIIVPAGGASITGSINVSQAVIAQAFTGSFTGSFTGNGSGLVGVTAAGTVSSSAQIDITATTGFTAYSSSLSTVDANQQTELNALKAVTSSYASNATIQAQLAGVASSSAQVKVYLPASTVSSSGQVDITATTGFTAYSSSVATVDANQQTELNALKAVTSSYASNATIQAQLAGVASSSAQVKAYLPASTVSSSGQVDITATTGFTAFSSSLSTVDANQQTELNALKAVTSSYATTGANTFTANQIISGSATITGNLTVQGSSSISYISQSTLSVGTNIITVNVQSPSVRFGGFAAIDSGSALSGSLLFDSVNDQWIFAHQNPTLTSSLLIMGPESNGGLGSETSLTNNYIPKSVNAEHIGDSQISDNGVTVSITKGLNVGTNLTASQADITTIRATSVTASFTGSLVGALTGTASFATTASAANSITFTPSTASFATTASYATFAANTLSSSVNIDAYSFTGNGVVTTYVLSQSYNVGSLDVSVGGMSLTNVYDYSLSGATLTFVTIPPSQSIVSIKALVNVTQGMTGSFSGSFLGIVTSASFATTASAANSITFTPATASFATTASAANSITFTPTTASYAQTASYALNAANAGVVSSSTQFTSLVAPFTGSFTGSFTGNGSGLTGVANTLGISGSGGTTGTVALTSQQLTVSGVNGIVTTISGQTLTISGSDATTSAKGVASFNTTNFTVTGGAVSSNNITINGTAVTLGGTRNITLQDITTQGASTTTATTFTNNATINATLYSGSAVTGIVGPVGNQVVASLSTGSFNSAMFDYVVNDGTNYRAGTVMSVWSAGSTEFTDTSTSDIGNTAQATFAVDVLTGVARLKFTNTSGTWAVKTAVRVL